MHESPRPTRSRAGLRRRRPGRVMIRSIRKGIRVSRSGESTVVGEGARAMRRSGRGGALRREQLVGSFPRQSFKLTAFRLYAEGCSTTRTTGAATGCGGIDGVCPALRSHRTPCRDLSPRRDARLSLTAYSVELEASPCSSPPDRPATTCQLAFRTIFSHPSILSLNIRYPSAACESGIRCVMTKVGSSLPLWMCSSSGCM